MLQIYREKYNFHFNLFKDIRLMMVLVDTKNVYGDVLK